MNKYYLVFGIQKFLWTNIQYLVFRKFSWTNTIQYLVFSILKCLMNEYYSVFGNFSWTNSIRYSEILHERIYSVFGIQSNSLFGATLIEKRHLSIISKYWNIIFISLCSSLLVTLNWLSYLTRISKALGSTSVMTIILSIFSARGPSSMALNTGDLSTSTAYFTAISSVWGSAPI